jgi:hypothetical protein
MQPGVNHTPWMGIAMLREGITMSRKDIIRTVPCAAGVCKEPSVSSNISPLLLNVKRA